MRMVLMMSHFLSLLRAMLLLSIGGRSIAVALNWFSIFLPRGFIF